MDEDLSSEIPTLNEGHSCDDGLAPLATDVYLEFCPLLVRTISYVAHCNVLSKCRRGDTRRDNTCDTT